MTRTIHALAIAALITFGGTACAGLPSDLGAVPDTAFTTDATGYVARPTAPAPTQYRFDVVTRFENRSAVPLFLGRCFPNSPQPLFSVVSADAAQGESGYASFWACVGHDRQFVVQPGEVRVDTLRVTGPNMFDGATRRPLGTTEGTFRVYFDVRLTPGDGGTLAPAAMKTSNAFVVRRG